MKDGVGSLSRSLALAYLLFVRALRTGARFSMPYAYQSISAVERLETPSPMGLSPGVTVEVHLQRCSDLKDVALVSQDPYCIVSWSNQKFRSFTRSGGGKDPVWDQVFRFENVTTEYPLRFELFNEIRLLRDKAIGECRVSLNKAFELGSVQLEVPVYTKSGKEKGFCYMSIVVKGLNSIRAVSVEPAQPQNPARPTPRAPAQPPRPPLLRPAPSGHAPNRFILQTYANTNCWADYEKGKLLGKGNFGKTYLAVDKVTRKEYAVKVIAKRMLSTLEAIQDVRNEVDVMHHLAGHPNVVSLEKVYEDRDDVCIVMELMRGGELFDAISKKGIYTEKDAAMLIRDIVSVIAKCHAESVIHRDIKPENFLLTDNGPNAKLKAADFGLSSFFKEGEVFTDIVGSLYYMAPEVLTRSYGKEADIWSCGVILYILLSGRPPFGAGGKTEAEVLKSIKEDRVDLESEPWDNISEPAKDCIRKMLKRNPEGRAKAQDILNNDWLRENGCASDAVIEVGVVSRMKKFNQGNKLKKAVTQMMVSKLPLDEINGLRGFFESVDQEKTGRITLKQFADALKQKGSKLPESELRAMWKEVDKDGDGTILYEEFLAATIHESKLAREDRMKEAFIRFDKDGDGFIGPEELRQGLKEIKMSARDIEDIIRQVDRDGTGTIDYNEFVVMLRDRD